MWGQGFGGHSRFFSAVVRPDASTKPISAVDSGRLIARDRLQGDGVVGEDRLGWVVAQTGRRAMDVQMIGTGRYRTVLERDLVAADALDVSEPHHVLDATELLDLAKT